MFGLILKPAHQEEREQQWAAFEAEAIPHMESIFRVAMWLVRDRAEAEDLTQETFVQALKSFHRYRQGTNCRAWLMTIMRHLHIKRYRAKSRLRVVDDSEEKIAASIAFEPPTPQGITDEEVLHALERIPAPYQEVILLSDVEDMSYKEIARTLQIPIGTVMSRLSRGRKLLRAELVTYANAHGIGRADGERGGSS
jgi:RNA polymerase sigma-70 factor (ECF subfamily)